MIEEQSKKNEESKRIAHEPL